MTENKHLSEQESLRLITTMIEKARSSYHDTGIGALLWGSVVSVASILTYLQQVYHFRIGFDIWLVVLFAIIPQIVISIREKKQVKARKYEDDALNAVWLIFGISIFALNAYQQIVPGETRTIIHAEGWEMMKHYTDGSKPDEILLPFAPSIYSFYIMLYAFPTLVTGIVKKFKPMIVGGVLTYGCFILSLYTRAEYDWLLGGFAAIVCWLIPGIILRRKYLLQKQANV